MIVKQGEIRANIKKYFDIAYEGEYILVPRKDNKNVVIISEDNYERMKQLDRLQEYAGHFSDLAKRKGVAAQPHDTEVPKIKSYLQVDDIKTENLNRLKAFREFENGWNGYDAEAFDPKLVDAVTDIITGQDIQPEIFPTALGTIQLEYDNSRGDHMEIEIGSRDHAEVFIALKTGQAFEEDMVVDANAIKKKVNEFYG